jgi:hypothetical protein
MIVAFGFAAGGYFPDTTGTAVALVAATLGLWIVLARRPFEGWSKLLVVAAVAMSLYCAWTFASTIWSDAAVRSAVEFDRALLYLLAMLLGASAAFTPERIRWVVRLTLAGAFVVCLAAFISRTLPDVLETARTVSDDRLSFPLTYWNNLGLLASLGLILSVALATDRAEGLFSRMLSAASAPLFAATLVLTFGRGPAAAGIAGLVVLLVFGRGPGMLAGLIATVPAVALAVYRALDAGLLATERYASPAGMDQGQDLAVVVVVAGILAATLVLVLRPLDRRLPGSLPRAVTVTGVVALIAILVAGAVAIDAPRRLGDAYDRFLVDTDVDPGQQRDRFVDAGNNGRLDHWRVAVDGFKAEPVRGSGAGTYELVWNRERPESQHIRDAHSLYLEVLAELGVVGLALLVTVLVSLLVGFGRRVRGPARGPAAGLLAAGVAWVLEAGVDWSWEMPGVTAWLFFAGGVALARAPRESSTDRRPSLPLRGLAVVALVVLSVLPIRIAISQARLDDSLRAFERGNCPAAIDSAKSSLSAFGSQAQAYAIQGYCDSRMGDLRQGVEMMLRATRKDPDDWQLHYGLALVSGAAGIDPRPAARKAESLSPTEAEAQEATRVFATDDPAQWRRASARLPLPEN